MNRFDVYKSVILASLQSIHLFFSLTFQVETSTKRENDQISSEDIRVHHSDNSCNDSKLSLVSWADLSCRRCCVSKFRLSQRQWWFASFVEHVYSANYSVVIRTSSEFLHNDMIMTYLLSSNERSEDIEIIFSDRICMLSQQFSYQSQDSSRLKMRAGKKVVLRYQKNEHVTLSHAILGKTTSETVFVYDIKKSRSTDTLLNIHKVWNKNETASDARERLLAEFDFDDEECYEPNFLSSIYQLRQKIFEANSGQKPNRWCWNRVQVPKKTTERLYTLYWIWDWSFSLDTPNGSMRRKNEIYTTCLDLHVVT